MKHIQKKHPPRVLSLFAGAGGLDLGFIQSGAEIIWANDIDKDACLTYANNIGDHIVCADIREVEDSDLPMADVVIGGFPCQGFSRANIRKFKEDERNFLYTELLRCIKTVRPKLFLAENVKGILSLDGGKVAQEIIEDFRNAGYRVRYDVVNAANYGVPQNRWRVFFTGVRNDLQGEFVPPNMTHEDPKKLMFGSSVSPWVTVSQALHNIPEPTNDCELKNHVGSQYKVVERDFTGHRFTNPDQPSPTILARGNGKGGVCALPHPNKLRRLTVRESAIIQTFPLDFEFSGGLMSMYRQIGNAVPVKLARAFGTSVVKTLSNL